MSGRPIDEALAQHILKLGLLTDTQLKAAIHAQAEQALKGEAVSLGEILVQQGRLTAEQRENIEKKLETQREDAKRLGPYRIVKKLGEGGMGAVYLAENPLSGQKIALKVLPKIAAKDEDAVRRFMREVDSARKLDHPNIVKAGAAGEDKGFHYYVMEYVEGETLGNRLKREEALSPDEAAKVVLQVAHGLKYAHEQGFIHRDIKPDNVILTRDGVAKILDMGLSKNIDEAQSFRTVTGVALGTPHYIAPEQARADKGIDGRADIYSLGATYYHLVTGETPFHGTTAIELIAQHLNKQIPDPRDIRDGIPDGVVHVIRNMMAKKPKDRYRDCAELVTDLELVLGGRNPSSQALDAAHSAVALPMARDARERYRAQRRGQRPGTYRSTANAHTNSMPLIVGGVLAAVVVVVLAVALGGGSTKPVERPAAAADEHRPGASKPATSTVPTAVKRDPEPRPVAPPPRAKTREEFRAEEAHGKLAEIKAVESRFAPDEIRRRYAEIARQYADTAEGKTIADWLKATEPKPIEPPAPEDPKLAETPKSTAPPEPKPPASAPASLPVRTPPPPKEPAPAAPPPPAGANAPITLPIPTKEALDKLKKRQEDLVQSLKTAKTAEGLNDAAAQFVALAGDAAEADQYDAALRALEQGSKASRLAKNLELTEKVVAETAKVKAAAAEYRKVESAVKRMTDSPDDAGANSIYGKYLCLVKEEWGRGLAHLSKGSDARLRELAQREGAVGLPESADAGAMIGLADGWWPVHRDRALYWYRSTWPKASPLQKEHVRERARQAQQRKGKRDLPPATGWSPWPVPTGTHADETYAHSGKRSIRCDGPAGFAGGGMESPPGRQYTLSAWVLTEGGSKAWLLRIRINDADGKFIGNGPGPSIPVDFPFWTFLTVTFTASEKTPRIYIGLNGGAECGTIWVDDLSIKDESGKELLQNGSFEQ